MNLRRGSTMLLIAAFAGASAANAAVHRVFPGENIQAFIDAASPGDTILVEPGEYTTPNADFGLRITTDNLRLIGKVKKGQGEDGKVRLVQSGTQETGVYAAPDGCGPGVGVGGCPEQLQGFYIRGFTVEDFPKNGIQTRFVNDFQIIRNESARNGFVNGNGIYPTISTNGLVQNNVSYGSLDTAMWVAASENVRVIGNEVSDSVIGLEITVSNNVLVMQNDIHDNTVGVGLFHPNAAGNAQLPVMEDWVLKNNNIYDNNRVNDAPPTSFQRGLPQGVGVLLLGVSNHVIQKNTVENNEFVGIAVLGWCSGTLLDPNGCLAVAPQADPSVNNNLISQNKMDGNGGSPPGGGAGPLDFLAADISYLSFWQIPPSPESSSGNCFEKNKPENGFTFSAFSAPPFPPFNGVPGVLPTDGC
jgi:parallel beta-helix repeat protein